MRIYQGGLNEEVRKMVEPHVKPVLWIVWAVLMFLFLRLFARNTAAALGLTIMILVLYLFLTWAFKKIMSLLEEKVEAQAYVFLVTPLVMLLLMISSGAPQASENNQTSLCVLEMPRAIAFSCVVGNSSRTIYSYDPDFSIINYAERGCTISSYNDTSRNYRVVDCAAPQPFAANAGGVTKLYKLAEVKPN